MRVTTINRRKMSIFFSSPQTLTRRVTGKHNHPPPPITQEIWDFDIRQFWAQIKVWKTSSPKKYGTLIFFSFGLRIKVGKTNSSHPRKRGSWDTWYSVCMIFVFVFFCIVLIMLEVVTHAYSNLIVNIVSILLFVHCEKPICFALIKSFVFLRNFFLELVSFHQDFSVTSVTDTEHKVPTLTCLRWND